ncbi:MAG TPA: hypothetical protein VFU88_13050 [Ktedonobacterales bacterium]|nr:hypothetical protein [Ktedonobacterales bacterium]
MRLWWSDRRERRVESSRPGVSRAVEAARLAYAAPAGLGSAAVATVGAGVLRHFFAVERAAEVSGPLYAKQTRRGTRGLEPELLRETARVAVKAGRTPEAIWAEALREWLAAYGAAPVSLPAVVETRRQAVWREIDATLSGLRAS